MERSGDEIVGVIRDEAMTLFAINHDDAIFEALGPAGRLWNSEAHFPRTAG